VPTERLARILARLSSAGDPAGTTDRLCTVSAELTETSGAGILLMSGDQPHSSICTTDDVSAMIEELQYTLGDGPCVDAFRSGSPVLEPDLASPSLVRWPGFTRPAVVGGVRAVFGFPMSVASVRIGALNLYRDRPGPLTGEQHAFASMLAAVAGRAVIAMQAGVEPGGISAELEVGTHFRLVVHQATGMVAEQLMVSVTEALVRLRAYAFSQDRTITDVANDVVAQRIPFGPRRRDSPPP
jgi:GAF domain-containing protein